MRNTKLFFALLGFALAGIFIRSATYQHVFIDGQVIFPGFDPYYHMRRIFQIMQDYPNAPYFDLFMNYPYGAAIIWPPLFDFSIATVNMALGYSPSDVRQVETVAAFIAPALGGLTVIPVYFLAKETLGEKQGLLAAALFVFIPAHIWYSQVGFVDHHVAITLAQVTMYAIFLRAYFVCEGHAGSVTRLLKSHPLLLPAASLSIVAGFLVWNGFIFFLAILDLFLLITLVTEGSKPGSKIPALCWITHLAAGVILLPFIVNIVGYTGNPFSAITLSYFHVGSVFAFAALGFVIDLSRLGLFSFLRRRLYQFVTIFSLVSVVIALGSYTGALAEGLQWVFTSDRFMGSVDESAPMLLKNGKLDLADASMWMTGFFLVVPFILLLIAQRLWKDRFCDKKKLFLLLWGGILFIIALKQKRFGDPFSPAQAILVSYFLFESRRYLANILSTRLLKPAMAGKTALALIALLTILAYGAHFQMNWKRYTPFLKLSDKDLEEDYHFRVYNSLTSFREIVESSPGRADNYGKPLVGVMSEWSLGHKILYVTRLPVVSNNFGLHIGKDSYADWVEFFMETSEQSAEKILRARNVRYIVADFNLGAVRSAANFLGRDVDDYFKSRRKHGILIDSTMKPALIQTVFFRLTRLAGSESTLTSISGKSLFIPAMDHFRLILDSVKDDKNGYLKVYEHVPGANLVISGQPEQSLTIRYKYVSMAGREREYKKTVTLDKSGRARATLPYSSDRPDLGHTALYRLAGEGVADQALFISERDVMTGGQARVDLASPGLEEPESFEPSDSRLGSAAPFFPDSL